MAKANLTIAISGSYNGRALQRAREDLEKMKIVSASEMGGVAGAFAKAGAKAAEMGGHIYNAGSKIEKMGSTVTKATAPVLALGAAAVASYNEVEAGMNNVRVATGAVGEQADALESVYREASRNVVGSFEDIGSALGELNTRFGMEGEELQNATEQTAKYAKVTGQDATQAVQEVASLMNNAQIEAKDYGKTLDELTVAGQVSGISVSKLATSVNQNAASLKEMGFNTEQSIALLANFEREGANTEGILAGMKKGVATWAKEGKDAATEFSKFSQGVQNGSVTMADAIEVFGSRSGAAMYDAAQKGQLNYEQMYESIVNNSNGALDSVYESTLTAADKMQLATKKIQERLTDTGAVVLDKVLPVVEKVCDGVEDLIDWFDGLDDGTKDMIVNMGLLAVAAGPVLTVGGKFIKGIGNLTVGAGKLMQKTSVLVASTKNAKKTIGDAAASVGTYGIKADKTGKIAKASSAQIDAMGNSAKSAGAKTKTAAGSIDKATTSMGKAGKAAGVLRGSLGGLGASLAAGLIVQGVMAIGGEIERAKEKAEKFEKATKSLNDTMGGYYSSLNSVSTAMQEGGSAQDGYTSKITNLRGAIDEMIESNAELADSVGSIFSEASASINEIDYYRDAIEKYAGKCLTSSSDVAELELAVKNLNDVMGTNYSVIKAEDGTYQIMADGARVAKDEILKLIDAQKLQIQLEANSEAWKEAYKGIKEQAALATQATKEYNDAVAYSDELRERVIAGDTAAIELQRDAEAAVTRTKQAMDEANGTYKAKLDLVNKLEDAQILYQQAMDNGVDSIESFVSSNDMLMATLDSADQSALGFTADLKDLGLSQADLKRIGEENMPALASIYDGSVASIKEKLSEFGVKLDEEKLKSKETAEAMEGHIASFGDTLKARFETAGVDIDSFCADLANAGVSTQDFQALSHEQLGYLAQHYDGAVSNIQPLLNKFIDRNKEAGKTSGQELGQKLISGVGAMRDRVSSQMRSVSDDARRGLGSADATSTGRNLVQGFLNGTNQVNVWNTLYGIGGTALKAIKKALRINSPSKEAAWIGEMFGEGLIQGMTSMERGIAAEARNMSTAMELSPSDYSYSLSSANSGVPTSSIGVGSKTFNVSLTVNVNTANRSEASLIGQTLGEQLYTELARRERAYA